MCAAYTSLAAVPSDLGGHDAHRVSELFVNHDAYLSDDLDLTFAVSCTACREL
jgi:hypothetical protein